MCQFTELSPSLGMCLWAKRGHDNSCTRGFYLQRAKAQVKAPILEYNISYMKPLSAQWLEWLPLIRADILAGSVTAGTDQEIFQFRSSSPSTQEVGT